MDSRGWEVLIVWLMTLLGSVENMCSSVLSHAVLACVLEPARIDCTELSVA
jgi:hypothetical protein